MSKFLEQTLANNFNTIINALGGDVTAMQATPPFPDGVTEPIVDSLRNVSTISDVSYISDLVGRSLCASTRRFCPLSLGNTASSLNSVSLDPFCRLSDLSKLKLMYVYCIILDYIFSINTPCKSFAFAMIDMIPTRQNDVQSDKDQLDQSVGNSISKYEQLCVPSPLYPSRPPICASA